MLIVKFTTARTILNFLKQDCINIRHIYTVIHCVNGKSQKTIEIPTIKRTHTVNLVTFNSSVDLFSVGGVCLSKNFCTSNMSIATYEEVKDLQNHPEKLLIDVREPNELQETGKIPTSINIPIGEIQNALKLDATTFKEKYGRDKPTANTAIIFHCKLGGRAAKAVDVAKSVGFSNLKNYKGSWTEWAEKEGLKQ